ncbi:MAG: sulfite exporter TauE/SafE family protein [Methylobacterium sp.]|nr:sulfite exporter TauE/SafE family protein [Methylobacterium sp.]MCA3628060.1 sulfite exporter TauE/SafE family protein [Methylobacterium sp.]
MTEAASLLDLAQPGPAITVAVAAFFASMASAITGAGGAIILSFALAPIIGVAAVVQTISVAMTVSHLARIEAFRREIDWKVSRIVLAGSIPGVILGAMIYTRLSERAIALLLGSFMLIIVVLKRRLPNRRLNLPMPVILLFSFGFGLVSGATIGGGILLLPILAAAGLTGAAFVATDAVIGLVVHLVKSLVFGSAAVLSWNLTLIGIVVGVMMIPGVYVARVLVRRMPLSIHAGLIDAVIVAGGLGFLYRAIGSFF